MDGSIFADLYRGLFWGFILVVVLGGATCFGVGYAARGCEYRPHFEFRKVDGGVK
jgi:hypothetical protein